ncbi:MAG: hypothetical protein LBE85_08805 [Candidatus Accumulibacter sp.]|jgi:hypothetical protein|nr:hypothetical protein [Accumulibacter sp.]
MLSWTPDPAIVPWHDVQADETWTEGPITAVDDEALLTVVGYGCEVVKTEPLEGLEIRVDDGGVTVSAPAALAGAFPAIDIEYQVKGTTGHCLTFADLPDEADEVIRFVPNPANTKDWTLRVTAHCADALTGIAQDFTADFILRVWANFDPDRDALREAVHARRC